MEYTNIESLTVKATRGPQSKGISAFIKVQLDAIPEDGALAVGALALALRTEFPHIDTRQSYVRVNMVLQRDGYKDVFQRLEDDKHKTFIARV